MLELKRCRSVALARVCLAAGVLASACALTSKGEPLTPRYFTPLAEPDAASAVPAAPTAAELRLGRVEPAAHLEERIAYRLSDTELAYYDDRRWSEPPDALVRRALERELFERRGLGRVVSGAAPTLEVDVLGFEELREKPPRARCSLRILLHDDRRAQLERTLTVDVPLATGKEGESGPALARAMAGALAAATRQAADAAVNALRGGQSSVAAQR